MPPGGLDPERERELLAAWEDCGLMDVASGLPRSPALAGPTAFLDGPAGTQVPDTVIQAMVAYLEESNANTGGAFAASVATDALVDHAQGDRGALPRRVARRRSASGRT